MPIGVLIDTISIQKYVFASYKLKISIGASEKIQNIYHDSLHKAVHTALGKSIEFNLWEKHPDDITIQKPDVDFEVGYIGGGNALLFFRKEEMAKKVISELTRNLLINAPGLKTAFAIGEVNFDTFHDDLENLHQQLRVNKNNCFPQTELFKHGITADCPTSGLSAETKYLIKGSNNDEEEYISSVSAAKLDEAENNPSNDYEIPDEYCFTTEIDKLGQAQGENHIAIVHIDGNAMGERFKACRTLPEIRKLSHCVSNVFHKTFVALVKYVAAHMNYLCLSESGFAIKKEGGKSILPIRPILLAGDDITFVCEGRLGVHLAEKFLRLLQTEELQQQISACAGVAITKSKYPFSMGYRLAEELCSQAKKRAYKEQGTSWLDFHLVYGAFSGSLKSVRENQFTTINGSLNFGPYRIDDDPKYERSITNLKAGIKDFQDIEKWPRSKVKELRTKLSIGRQATEDFLNEMRLKKIVPYELPESSYLPSGFVDGVTPYFEMIELMEFYPAYFLNNEGGIK